MSVRMTPPAGGLGELVRAAKFPAVALLLGLAVFALSFHAEAAAAVSVWIESTAYGHCFFVVPIAAYLAWDRRHRVAGVPVVPMPAAMLAVLPLGVVWLAAERLGIMEGRQLLAMTMLQVLFLAVLGWRMYRALLAPLLYLYFLVPFGAFITPQLQDFTARFTIEGLNILGIPTYSDGFQIEIPEGRFYVAEACAGLRFLIASIAFGVLYACLIYRSPVRRLLFIGASVVVPIIANGFRALGIVVLGHILGSAQAAAADHLIYGWLFFSAVILLLTLAGLPFREDLSSQPARVAPPPTAPGVLARALLAALGVGVFAAAGPAVAAWLDRAADVAVAAPELRFAAPANCSVTPMPALPGTQAQQYTCPAGTLVAVVQAFPARVNPGRLLGALREPTGELAAEDSSVSSVTVPGVSPLTWRLVATSQPSRLTAELLWVNGGPLPGGLAGRLELARNSVFGAAHEPLLIWVSAGAGAGGMTDEESHFAPMLIQTFLQAQTALPGQLARLPPAAP